MPNVMGREFPYTAEGMAAAQQYSQAMGMRDGGSMGFRPVGYGGGGSVPAGYQDGDVVMDEQDRVVLIEYLMDMTGMGPNTFVEMSNTDLMRAREKVDADALKAETQRQQMPPPAPSQAPNFPGVVPDSRGGYDYYSPVPDSLVATGMGARAAPEMMNRLGIANRIQDDIEAGIPTRGSASGPDLTGAELLSRLSPEEQALFIQQRNSAPVEMNRGGIMSLRGY
jgi:hypothetical protein